MHGLFTRLVGVVHLAYFGLVFFEAHGHYGYAAGALAVFTAWQVFTGQGEA